jgi:hypothetical protein
MPAKGTKEYNLMKHQLSSGPAGLDAKIKEEIEANEGRTVWSDRKARFLDCIAQKITVMPSRDVWEENCADFKACDGMPVRGTKEYNWRNQFSSGPAGLDSNIKKENEANEGGTVRRDRKARLAGCIATKMSA